MFLLRGGAGWKCQTRTDVSVKNAGKLKGVGGERELYRTDPLVLSGTRNNSNNSNIHHHHSIQISVSILQFLCVTESFIFPGETGRNC